jgi:uncharacterized protein (DUF2236 family)
MLGSLPQRVRELYGLGWSHAQDLAFGGTVAGLRAARPVTPGRVRRGRNAGSYDLVARTEQRRIDRGEPTPQAPASRSA